MNQADRDLIAALVNGGSLPPKVDWSAGDTFQTDTPGMTFANGWRMVDPNMVEIRGYDRTQEDLHAPPGGIRGGVKSVTDPRTNPHPAWPSDEYDMGFARPGPDIRQFSGYLDDPWANHPLPPRRPR